MAFSRVKPAGWAYGEILTSSQMNSLDTDHANAIDGAGGGTYTLSAPLSITGDTVTLGTVVTSALTNSGDLAVDGIFQANGDAYLGDGSGDAVYLGGGSSDVVRVLGVINGAISVANDGRMRESGQIVSTLLASVDVTQHQNILLNAAITSTTTTTLTGSVGDGDWFLIYNDTGQLQNLAGLVTAANFPINTGRKYVRISGSWVSFQFIAA